MGLNIEGPRELLNKLGSAECEAMGRIADQLGRSWKSKIDKCWETYRESDHYRYERIGLSEEDSGHLSCVIKKIGIDNLYKLKNGD